MNSREALCLPQLLGILVLALILAPGLAAADVLYGANQSGRQLIAIDTVTLEGSVVGLIGIPAVAGLTFDPDRVLYGLSVANPDRLITVDPATGAGVAVGPTGVDGDLGAGLASSPLTGTLYAVTGQIGQKLLITLSPSTGNAAVIGPVPRSVVGLTFDASGALWAIDGAREELIRIDLATGEVTLVAWGLPSAIGSLAAGSSGNFWAVDSSGSNPYRLYSINPATGATTLQGYVTGLSWQGPMIGLAAIGSAVDSDGDGLPDDADPCPFSDFSPTLRIDDCETDVSNQSLGLGCTMSDLIATCSADADNLGGLVGCIARLASEWHQADLLSSGDIGAIQSCAARADLP
jgi:hypothetical protein